MSVSFIDKLGSVLESASDAQLKAIGETLQTSRANASNLGDASESVFSHLIKQVCKAVLDRSASDVQSLVAVTEAFGIAARDQDLHELLRNGGAIEYVMDVFAREAEHIGRSKWLALRFEAWRLVANICADDDEARERISADRAWLAQLFAWFSKDFRDLVADPGDLDEAAARCIHASSQALYNIVGYEPARPRCLDAGGAVLALNDILKQYAATARSHPGDDVPLPVMIWDLVEELAEDPSRFPADFATNIVFALLHEGEDIEGKETVIALIPTFTKLERFSAEIASDRWQIWCLVCLYYNLQGETWVEPPRSEDCFDLAVFKPLENPPSKSDERAQLLSAIADVVERKGFRQAELDDKDMRGLANCLSWPDSGHSNRNEEFLECICMILGNYAQSDQTSRRLLSASSLESRLKDVLEHAEQYSTRTMATRLLKNLAIPATNKDVLGKDGDIFGLLSYGIKESVRGELLQASISTSRVLISGKSAKHAFSTPLSSQDQIQGASGGPTTFLRHTLFIVDQVDDQGIKVECGRFLKRLLSCLYAECDASDVQAWETTALPGIPTGQLTGALAALILQKQNAVVRSEGWLALALLAKSADGAARVGEMLSQPPVLEVIKATLAMADDLQSVATSGSTTATEDIAANQQQAVVTATTQQRDHDKANVELLLRTVAQKGVRVTIDGQAVDPQQLLEQQM